MRNTLAIGIILAGSVLILSAFKNWKLLTTLQVILGMKPWDYHADGGGRSMSGTIAGNAVTGNQNNPAYRVGRAPQGYKWEGVGKSAYLVPTNPNDANTPAIPRDSPKYDRSNSAGVPDDEVQVNYVAPDGNTYNGPYNENGQAVPDPADLQGQSGTRAQSGILQGF